MDEPDEPCRLLASEPQALPFHCRVPRRSPMPPTQSTATEDLAKIDPDPVRRQDLPKAMHASLSSSTSLWTETDADTN
jgi:hypothetical protein